MKLKIQKLYISFRGRIQAGGAPAPAAQRPADPHRQRDPGLGQRAGQPRAGRGRAQPCGEQVGTFENFLFPHQLIIY